MASSSLTGTGVPFVDLSRTNTQLKETVLARLADLIDRGEFGSGPTVAEFEDAFARWTGTSGCAGVASGLDALRLALRAAGLEPGDEVIVPANTFIATFEAIAQAGGTPVPADAWLVDLNLDPAAASAAVTGRSRFLLPVHLYGQLADMTALTALADRHDLAVLEDAAQAHGASRDGRRPGDGTLAAAFSFYPAKNLGAFGDAGAVISNDAPLIERVRVLREHGQTRKYEHSAIGWTSRLDAFQAAVLTVKLESMNRWTAERRAAAVLYGELLRDVGDLELPPVPANSQPVWHLYPVRTADPVDLATRLSEHGISTGRHYPQPPHLSEAFRGLGFASGAFPVAESIARTELSLPMFPGITEGEVESVAACIRDYFDNG